MKISTLSGKTVICKQTRASC